MYQTVAFLNFARQTCKQVVVDVSHSVPVHVTVSPEDNVEVTSLLTTAGQKRRRKSDAPTLSLTAATAPARLHLQLSRVTVSFDSTRHAADICTPSAVLNSYDIVAVRPGDAASLRHAADCGAVDIIQLDLAGGRLPFALRVENVEHVLRAGLVFEVDVAAAIRDSAARQYLISNTNSLLRLTRGRGILLTSGARTPLELRSPLDTAAIASLMGMSRGDALAAMSRTAQAVLKHAQQRRHRISSGSVPGLVVHVVPSLVVRQDVKSSGDASVAPTQGGLPLEKLDVGNAYDPLDRIARLSNAVNIAGSSQALTTHNLKSR